MPYGAGLLAPIFDDKVEMLLQRWICAIAEVLMTEGLDQTLAVQRAEDAVLAIEGSLILSQGLNDFAAFERVLNQLPQQICQDLT